MSMYANSSEQYWNSRKKQQSLDKRKIATAICILFFLSCLCYSGKTLDSNGRLLIEEQPSITNNQVKACNRHFKSNQNQCQSICKDERSRGPRPTIHQACLHGCNVAFSEATEKGCQDLVKLEVLTEVNGMSYQHCNKYLNMIPKPEIFSVCRKYHKIASEKGFVVSKSYIKEIIEMES